MTRPLEMDDWITRVSADPLPVTTDGDRFAAMGSIAGVTVIPRITAARSVVEWCDVVTTEYPCTALAIVHLVLTTYRRQEENQQFRYAHQESKRASDCRADHARQPPSDVGVACIRQARGSQEWRVVVDDEPWGKALAQIIDRVLTCCHAILVGQHSSIHLNRAEVWDGIDADSAGDQTDAQRGPANQRVVA